jgi:RNA polymerase sigma factor (sigma-70 family)
MADLVARSVGRQIESLFDGSSVAGLTDRQLLERFTSRRDAGAEVAFTALVTRHWPMVLGICRQILGDRHLAEDAFQAVFIVLACKARSIRQPDLVGSWLYGVALRTAQKAKTRLRRQRKNEEHDALRGPGATRIAEPLAPPADVPAMVREQGQILHDEIAGLPGSFRVPLVLCYFEGLTLVEAAHRLQCPVGTIRSRLARAKAKLRRRLARRGLVLPAAALTAGLSPRLASAFVSPALCDITKRAAIKFAAGEAASPLAASLAREVLRAMFANKLRHRLRPEGDRSERGSQRHTPPGRDRDG